MIVQASMHARESLPVRAPASADGQALLAREPLVVVGSERVPPLIPSAVRPDRKSCFGPRGAVLFERSGPLWVCDTGHHRLLGWQRLPTVDCAPADWVIGQPGFDAEGRNARGSVTSRSLNVPTGICRVGKNGLAVADAWNHRVLLWKVAPEASGVAPDVVLGQADFASAEANRGRDAPRADTLFWPYGVAWCDGWLCVADSENRRVLAWRGVPESNGQPADLVLGQESFERRDENSGAAPDRGSMRWPHGICSWQSRSGASQLCISDAGNNRILVYRSMPQQHGAPADIVLGQANGAVVDHNQSSYWPRASTLNMPYGLSAAGSWLLCADTANSRLLGYHVDDLATGANARALFGQSGFERKGDNRWQPAAADSLCWPYAVSTCADATATRVVVADSGNNRVSVWELAV